ncbi:MAG: RtcB family protein [Ardenticatenaceae bacterium]|nr:RtcB family protein [Ardenticatenaceae bacterium]
MIAGKQLIDNGWPQGKIIGLALDAAKELGTLDDEVLMKLESVRAFPGKFLTDGILEPLAREWLEITAQRIVPIDDLRDQAVPIYSWGRAMIDQEAIDQMEKAARLPIAVQTAVMPDAHVGYGLPIGGVLAAENAVIPYGVGVDIACRMRISICAISPHYIDQKRKKFEAALLDQTRFGMGTEWEHHLRPQHPVMDKPEWSAIPLLQRLKSKAWAQLGTSGSGNHFVEWGLLELEQDATDLKLTAGKYVALLSHSGSRNLGATIAQHYTKVAQQQHPKLEKGYKELAWLHLDSGSGAEYWLAMNLAGDYASANHAVIHERVLAAVGVEATAVVENHHNFAWQEQTADGTPVIVHRKGATPAGAGVLGVIPGSMGDPGYIVRGLGNPNAINSASHGAGRKLSRKQAFDKIDVKQWEKLLTNRSITLLGGSLDEAPQAYKDIDEVMAAQSDLVEIVAKFMPRIVRMADDKPPKWAKGKKRGAGRRRG